MPGWRVASMRVHRCLEVLELGENASMEEVRRAYRDLVRVWHPDRFFGDPALERRAEEKSKQLNVAYETLVRHLEGRTGGSSHGRGHGAESGGATEALFEMGTRTVLTLWHSLSRAVRAAVEEAGTERKGRETHTNGT